MSIDHSDEVGWPAKATAVRRGRNVVTREQQRSSHNELCELGAAQRNMRRLEVWQLALYARRIR